MKYVIIVLSVCFTGISISSFSQNEATVDEIARELLENLAEEDEDMVNSADILEDLQYYAENPLNINFATEEELERLHVLNSFQVKSLKDYIQRNGPLLSVYEISYVFGFRKKDVKRLEPLIKISQVNENKTVGSDLRPGKIIKYGKSKIILRGKRRFEKPVGYNSTPGNTSHYLGDIYRWYTKYKFDFKDRLKLGFTMDKDPGEEFFRGTNKQGFDFYSFHFFYQGERWLKSLAIGDYQVNFGQGLTQWSGFSFGKSSDGVNVMKTGGGIDDYSSSNENKYLRGMALKSSIGHFDITTFLSIKNIDASIKNLDSQKPFFTSFKNTGYHRTASEIEDESVVAEKMAGGDLTYNGSDFEVGISGVYYRFNLRRQLNSDLYRQFQFSGIEGSNAGIHYKYLLGDFYFFGEEAINQNGGFALLNGVNCRFTPDISLALLHRFYDKVYFARYSAAFGENSMNSNESGVYTGFNIKLLPSLTGAFYLDVYQFSWLRYRANGPSVGNDLLFDLNYEINENNTIYFRFKKASKQLNDNAPNLSGLDQADKYRYRLHFSSEMTEEIRWSNRIEFTKYTQTSAEEYGWLFYQDLRYKLLQLPIILNFRYAVFDTDSYNSRIYAYEHDVLYAFSVPAYYLKGYRTYLNLHYDLDNLDLYFKVSQTKFMNKESIGTGLNEVAGDKKTEAKLQVIFKF